MNTPNLEIELALKNRGYTSIAGLDEVGRGPWAGPIVACAVILPVSENVRIENLNDSKKLTQKRRETVEKKVRGMAISIGIGSVDIDIIDKIGIGKANKLAFLKSLLELEKLPDYILLDYLSISINDLNLLTYTNFTKNKKALALDKLEDLIKNRQKSIKFGDSISSSIAAASVVAKIHRDDLMRKIHSKYPKYNFFCNKGYPSKEHIQALHTWGPCEIHRKSFAPIKKLLNLTNNI